MWAKKTALFFTSNIPADIYLFNAKDGKTRIMRGTCSKLAIKTPIRR